MIDFVEGHDAVVDKATWDHQSSAAVVSYNSLWVLLSFIQCGHLASIFVLCS